MISKRWRCCAIMLAAAACRAAPPPLPANAEAPAAAGDTAWAAATMPGWEAPAEAAPAWYVFRGRDPGSGLVFFPFEGLRPPVRLVLPIHSRADESAPQVGRFILDMPDGSSYSYRVDVREAGLSANVLEYGYEESGLPLDSLSADEEWARVIYAFDAAGVRRGWARLGSAGVDHIRWRDWLAERAQFFVNDESIDLRDAPAGGVVAFPLERSDAGHPGRYDYHLEPDSVAGDWLRVRIVTPSNACGIEPAATRDTVAWTRRVDDSGRPLVWYYTRGC